jgi:exopolysaccharide biosynthesis polyprenyl glycosylphosphotransferase
VTPPPDVDSPTASTALRAVAPRLRGSTDGPLSLGPRVLARRYCERDRAVRRRLALADAGAVTLALVLAFLGESSAWSHVGWGLLTIPMWLVINNAYGLYARDIKRISHGTVDDLPGLAHALLVGCLLMWLYYHVVPSGHIRFKYILLFGLLYVLLALASRTAVRRGIRRRLGPERVLLVGDDDAIAVLASKLAGHPEYGVKVVGQVAQPRGEPVAPGPPASIPRLCDVEELEVGRVGAELGVHRIVISYGDVRTDKLLELVRGAQEAGIKVAVVPQPFDAMGPSVEVDNVEGLTVFGMYPPVLGRSSRTIKRVMDIAGSAVLLVLCGPLLAAIALAIKLDSPGGVFFHQRRVGRGGERFFVLKFRTMVTGADEMVGELFEQSNDPDWLLLKRDPRVTRVGAILRRASLDELPQLWNVLKGEMSLVGPRPLVEFEDRKIDGWGRCRIDLTPGMTGLWQVLGRSRIPFRGMVALDYLYVTNWSLWGDIKLLLSTLPALVSRRGAN